MTSLNKAKIDAYAYLVRIGEYYITSPDPNFSNQKEVPNEYKIAVAEKLTD